MSGYRFTGNEPKPERVAVCPRCGATCRVWQDLDEAGLVVAIRGYCETTQAAIYEESRPVAKRLRR